MTYNRVAALKALDKLKCGADIDGCELRSIYDALQSQPVMVGDDARDAALYRRLRHDYSWADTQTMPPAEELIDRNRILRHENDTLYVETGRLEDIISVLVIALNNVEDWLGGEIFDDDDKTGGNTQEDRAEDLSDMNKQALEKYKEKQK